MPISSIIKWSGGKRSQAAAAFNCVVCGDVYAPLIAIWRGDFVYLDPPYANSHNRYVADLDVNRLVSVLRRVLHGVRERVSESLYLNY